MRTFLFLLALAAVILIEEKRIDELMNERQVYYHIYPDSLNYRCIHCREIHTVHNLNKYQ